MPTAHLLTGSNIGRKAAYLTAARKAIAQRIGTITAQSGLYRTAAWGNKQQADFINQALTVDTQLPPQELLAIIQNIEQNIGRIRREKWGPRIIDIDILLYDQICMQTPNLIIPHPHLHSRRFVLVPLCEIAPNITHPQFGCSIAELLQQCPDLLTVEELKNKDVKPKL